MRFLKSITLVSATLFFLLAPGTTKALSTYRLTPANFNQVISEIEEQYGNLIRQGTGLEELINFLHEQLTTFPMHDECQPPRPSISLSPQGNLLFSWQQSNGSNKYHSAYFSLFTGATKKYKTIESKVMMNLAPYNYHLFTFFSECSERQGHINLIIIDRDVFTLNNAVYPFDHRIIFANPGAGFKIAPNPAGQHLQVDYQLASPQAVSMTLRDVQGRLMQPLFRKGWQAKGKHQEQIDLSGLPPGIYIFTLIADRPYSKRLIIKE